MRIEINGGAVIVYQDCPAKGQACMCTGACNKVRAYIPLSDWNKFINGYAGDAEIDNKIQGGSLYGGKNMDKYKQ